MKHILFRNNRFQRILSGFTVIEMAIVIGAVGIAAGTAVPMYQRYIARNSMEIARQNVAQGIERAKFLSQVGMNDSKWGFSTDAIPGRGVLFMGESFATRDSSYDELYRIPESVTVTGLTEVTFEKVTGLPSQTGEISLRSLYDEETIVQVTLGETGEVDVPADWLEICIDPYGPDQQTIRVPDSLWTAYQEEGALIGACSNLPPQNSSSSSSSTSSSTSSSSVPVVTPTEGVGGAGAPITIDPDGTVTIADGETMTFTAEILGTALRISSGYDAPITVRFKAGSGPFIEPWGDYTKPVQGNVNNTNPAIFTSDPITGVADIDVWARSFRKKKSWYDGTQNNHFNQHMQIWTPHNDILVRGLVNGDDVPDIQGAGGQLDVEDYLTDYIDFSDNTIQLEPNQVIYLFELWTTDLNSASADFQDLILLMTFNTTP